MHALALCSIFTLVKVVCLKLPIFQFFYFFRVVFSCSFSWPVTWGCIVIYSISIPDLILDYPSKCCLSLFSPVTDINLLTWSSSVSISALLKSYWPWLYSPPAAPVPCLLLADPGLDNSPFCWLLFLHAHQWPPADVCGPSGHLCISVTTLHFTPTANTHFFPFSTCPM